jgi:hypothetical protein
MSVDLMFATCLVDEDEYGRALPPMEHRRARYTIPHSGAQPWAFDLERPEDRARWALEIANAGSAEYALRDAVEVVANCGVTNDQIADAARMALVFDGSTTAWNLQGLLVLENLLRKQRGMPPHEFGGKE